MNERCSEKVPKHAKVRYNANVLNSDVIIPQKIVHIYLC
jgi:hypothetical protein